MAGVTFVPTYQGLSAVDLIRPSAPGRVADFPLGVPHRLAFYRARNAIYHLMRALVARHPNLTVLAPDYNSGNEILAIRAAGARICYYPVDRRMQPDPDVMERLCDQHRPDLVYVIHYVGWPQPIHALRELCWKRELPLVEDCALSLLSTCDGQPLGSFGDWSVFCLYKTLPLPNGALLIQNGERLESLAQIALRDAGTASVAGRTAELVVQRIRGRASHLGLALQACKRAMGRVAGALEVRRANVGDIGFNLDEVDLAMSPVSARLLERLDTGEVRRRRIENYRLLDATLDRRIPRVFETLPEGVCPLFFPVLVDGKHETARQLWHRGVDALEFWNDSVDSGDEMSSDARYLRSHVLELPIHQDLTPRHIEHIARAVDRVVAPKAFAVSSVALRPCRTEWIDSPSRFTALRPHWDALLDTSAGDTPFLTGEWLQAWSTHLRGHAGLRTIAVWDGPELVAAMPLVRTRTRLQWPARLEFAGAGEAGSDYLDLVASAGYEDEAVRLIARALAAAGAPVLLDHVPRPSLSAGLVDELRRTGWTDMVVPGGVCPVIPLAGHTWDSFLGSLGAAHRANIRRRLRVLEQRFDMQFEPVTTDAQRTAALDALSRFHQRRFDVRGGSTAFRTPALRAFHEDATRLALDRGWLRMFTLVLDKQPAAVMYGFAYNRQFYFYQHGFDDQYERHSIGLAVMALSVRAALAEGLQTFDMLWGTEGYKRLWTSTDRQLERIHLFPPGVAGRACRRLTAARCRFGPLVRRVLPMGGRRAR